MRYPVETSPYTGSSCQALRKDVRLLPTASATVSPSLCASAYRYGHFGWKIMMEVGSGRY